MHDIEKLQQFFLHSKMEISPEEVTLQHLQSYVQWVSKLGMQPASQARMVSGIRAFYRYLMIEDLVKQNPAELLELPELSDFSPVRRADEGLSVR